MNISAVKTILIKITIALLTICLIYSVFWFYKIGQMEKQLNRFVSENASNVSIGSFEISGYPFAQNLAIDNLRFSLPTAALNKYQITISKLKAKATIFDTNFDIEITENNYIQDKEGKQHQISFNTNPKITAEISDGFLQSFSYQDSGHQILSENQDLIYSSSSTDVKVSSSKQENGSTAFIINSNITEISNFGIFDIYKNAFEEKLINTINTGEISLNSELPQNEKEEITEEINNNLEQNLTANNIPQNLETQQVTEPLPANPSVENSSNVDNSQTPTQEIKPAENQEAKTNINIAMQYILTPNQARNDGQTPLNITQIQESSLQYSKSLKIDSLSISNYLYKILINGTINIFSDDTMPSGAISIRLEKFLDIISYVDAKIKDLINQNNSVAINNTSNSNQAILNVENLPNEVAADNNEKTTSDQENNPSKSYHDFLIRINSSIEKVSKEIAEKNAASDSEVAQFEIRREKNLEFLVNETPVREILGKF